MQVRLGRLELPRDVRRQQFVAVENPQRAPAVDRDDWRHQRYGCRHCPFARESRAPAYVVTVDLLHVAQPWDESRASARTDGQVAAR